MMHGLHSRFSLPMLPARLDPASDSQLLAHFYHSLSQSWASCPCASPPPEGNGVIIAVIIICILLLAILGSVLYFLYKKGKICGRSGKQDL